MIVRLLIVWAIVCAGGSARAEPADPQLAAFIDRQLIAHDVPGASVVAIRDHKIAWSQPFGVANVLTREPVTLDTAFPAASNGKPIAAWLVVQLAAKGAFDLDKPVLDTVPTALPATPRHRRVTPWHLLTHTSGLGNFLRDRTRDLDFEPGARFSYSGVGFMVLQDLLEAKARATLDAHARRELFVPLGMTRSWYGERPREAARLAAPHVDLVVAFAPLAIAALPLFALLSLIALAEGRIRTGAWRLGAPLAGAVALVAVAIVAAVFYCLSGSWPLTLWFVAVPTLIATFVVAAGFATGRRAARTLTWLALATALVVFRDTHLPLPAGPDEANAAASLHATAPDLAKFLIELARPSLADTGATRRMTTAQQNIDRVGAWGLGIGVERHPRGRDLWQWGDNPGAKSLMIVSPETGDGVVILTNGENGGELARRVASRILGRDGCWRARCADD